MSSTPFEKPIARGVFLAGVLLMAASLPLSKVGMSIGQFLMAIGWFLEGRIIARFRDVFRNRIVLALISLYLLHVIGVAWSQEFDWALKDLRIKLPLFILPILFASGPRLKTKEIYWILGIFMAAVLAGSLISTGRSVFSHISDARDLSPYISHIRFSLEVCLAIAFSIIFAMAARKPGQRVAFILLGLWLFLFLFILRAFTGFLIFASVSYLALGHAIVHSRNPVHKRRWALVLAVFVIAGGTGYSILNRQVISKDRVDFRSLPTQTAQGNPYTHDTLNRQTINGHYVWLYMSEPELKSAWEERSELSYDHVDEGGWVLRYILGRYMTSRGLTKDAAGLASLTDEEIRLVESGHAYAGEGIPGQIMERVNDIFRSLDHYRQTGDASGNSMTQRLELWKNGWSLFQKNWLFGVGTGDVRTAFAGELYANKSSMEGSPLRAHNQMLTFAITFGIAGLLLVLFSLFWPILRLKKVNSPMYVLFFLIAFISLFTEDTFETQAGVTFFAFFNALLLFYDADPLEISERKETEH